MIDGELWHDPEEADGPPEQPPPPEEFLPNMYCYLVELQTRDAYYRLVDAFYVDDGDGKKWTQKNLGKYREKQARLRDSLPTTGAGMTPQEVDDLYRHWATEFDYWRRMKDVVDEKTAKKPTESAFKKGASTETRDLPQVFEAVVLQVFLAVQENYLRAKTLYDELQTERRRAEARTTP